MATVQSARKAVLNRVAIVAVLVATIIFLAPIYWIASTAFKPRSLATTVPPTVFFQPEISPFVKLFTKRVQMRKPVDPAVYAAAPWWESASTTAAKSARRRRRQVQLSRISEPLHQQPDRRHHLDGAGGRHGHHHRLRLLALQGEGRGGPALLHPVDAHAAAGGRRDPDVPDVPGGRPQRHAYRPDHPLHRLQPVLLGLADEGLHGRDPEGI